MAVFARAMWLRPGLLVAVSLLAAGWVRAETRLECPGGVAATQQAADLAVGWTAVDLAAGDPHPLQGAGVSEGPPQELRTLKPERTEGRPGQGRFVQHFRWAKPAVGHVHLVCRYAGTTLVVHRPVEPDPRQCALEILRSAQGMAPAVLRCE